MSRGKQLLIVMVLVFGTGATRAEEKTAGTATAVPAGETTGFAALADDMHTPCTLPNRCVVTWMHGKKQGCEHLWQWLTYKSPRQCANCPCRKQCNPCGTPRLYTFFLCNANGGCGAKGCAAGAADGHVYGR